MYDWAVTVRLTFSLSSNILTSTVTNRRVGSGLTGMILRYSPEIVQKVPFGGDDQFVLNAIKHEITAYERLGPHPRILKYLGSKGSGFLLEYHEKGCLRQELESGAKMPSVKWVL